MDRGEFIRKVGLAGASAGLLGVAPLRPVLDEGAARTPPSQAARIPRVPFDRDLAWRDLVYGIVHDNRPVIARAQDAAGMVTPSRYEPTQRLGWYRFPTVLWRAGTPDGDRGHPRWNSWPYVFPRGDRDDLQICVRVTHALIDDHDPDLGRIVEDSSWMALWWMLTQRGMRLTSGRDVLIALTPRKDVTDADVYAGLTFMAEVERAA